MKHAIFSYLHKNCTFFLFNNEIVYRKFNGRLHLREKPFLEANGLEED